MLNDLTTMLVYLTAAVIAAWALTLGFVGLKKRELLPTFLNYAFGGAIGYAFPLGSILLYLTIKEMKADGDFNPQLFYPFMILVILLVIFAIGGILINTFKKDFLKKYLLASGLLALCGFITVIIYGFIKNFDKDDFTVSDNVLLSLFVIIFIAVLFVVPMLFGRKGRDDQHTKSIVYAALCIALSFTLSYLKLFELPQGGSITFASLLPLMIYSYIFGIRKGVVAGLIYGVLQAMQDPWILHPLQFLLDYPLAFAMIGLTGFLRDISLKFASAKDASKRELPAVLKKNSILTFSIAAVAACVLRYACHLVSGIIVFDIYVPSDFGAGPVAWSFLYNLFVFADCAIVLVAGGVLFASKNFRELLKTI